MPPRKLGPNKRAVSTVISTVLMTSLAITMGTLVVFWASQTLGVYQGGASVFFLKRGEALKENFVIEDIWFFTNATNKYVNITVRNVGSIQITIMAIHINATAFTGSPLPITLTVGQSRTITLTFNYDATKVYFFVVATERGNQVREFWKASN